MTNRIRTYRYQIIIVLVMFFLVIVSLGVLLDRSLETRMDKIVVDQLKNDVSFAVNDYYRSIDSEMETLDHIANLIQSDEGRQKDEDDINAVINLTRDVFSNEPRIIFGMMTASGETIFGESLSPREYSSLLDSMRGIKSISYTSSGGVLYTYPVIHGDNVRYVLYMLCSADYIRERHNIDDFVGIGDVMIVSKNGNDLIGLDNLKKEKYDFYRSKSVKNKFNELFAKHNTELVSVELVNSAFGEMFLYTAEIKNTPFMLIGGLDKESATYSHKTVVHMIIGVYFAYSIIVFGLAIYLVFASVKIRESDALREAKTVAENASRAKGDFLASMSHEIRTPINAVLGFDEMILRETRDPTLRQYAMSIQSSTKSLLDLVNNILDYSRMEAGKITLANEPYELDIMVNELVMMIRPRSEAKNLQLTVFVNPKLPIALIGDVIRLKQVIINLLSNAVKYTQQGFVNLVFDFDPIDDKQINLKISVKDSGIGMKEEDIKKLFNAFERFDEEKNKTVEGTGLGMSITKQILDKMNTKLDVQSIYGVGSKFSFNVIQKISNAEEIGDFDPMKQKARPVNDEGFIPSLYAPDAHVLLVDDTEMNLIVVQGLLKHTGIQIDVAKNGVEALECMKNTVYDTLLIDQRMPVMDGMVLIKKIRENTFNANFDKPCVLLTANTVQGVREQGLAAGYDDYLEKPVDGKTLEATLRKYLPENLVENIQAVEDVKTNSNALQVEEADEKSKEIAENESSDNTTKEKSGNDLLKDIEEKGYIDSEAGISYAGSMEMFVVTLQFFRDSVDKKADEIENYYNSKDIENYTTKVHALKSSARIIGATELSELALSLEKAGNAKDMEYIDANTEKLLKMYRGYKEHLANI